MEWIEAIDQFNDTPGEGTTRQYLTDADWAARRYLLGEMERLGLQVEMDCMGSLFGTLPGTEPDLAPVWTGSHFDTVLHGGRFDGVAGLAAGLEALRVIAASKAPHRRPLTVVAYAGEEPARFGIGCIGSRALAGRLGAQDLRAIRAADGTRLSDALEACGLSAAGLDACRRRAGDVFCALELHIEQGSVLEREQVPMGIVQAICAPLNLVVTVTGQAAHAGGLSMTERQDALAAACEMSLALEHMVWENRESPWCTGTVGQLTVEPNAPNIIPGRVTFTVDVRDCDGASKDRLLEQIQRQFQAIAQRRRVALQLTVQNNDPPVSCHPALTALLERCCAGRGTACRELVSGAFHDSLFVGSFAPVGMLFVPSREGLSHCPQEWTGAEELRIGAQVLTDALLALSNWERLPGG